MGLSGAPYRCSWTSTGQLRVGGTVSGRRVGYTRVSTLDLSAEPQLEAIRELNLLQLGRPSAAEAELVLRRRIRAVQTVQQARRAP